jgi:hypothetical protein
LECRSAWPSSSQAAWAASFPSACMCEPFLARLPDVVLIGIGPGFMPNACASGSCGRDSARLVASLFLTDRALVRLDFDCCHVDTKYVLRRDALSKFVEKPRQDRHPRHAFVAQARGEGLEATSRFEASGHVRLTESWTLLAARFRAFDTSPSGQRAMLWL